MIYVDGIYPIPKAIRGAHLFIHIIIDPIIEKVVEVLHTREICLFAIGWHNWHLVYSGGIFPPYRIPYGVLPGFWVAWWNEIFPHEHPPIEVRDSNKSNFQCDVIR